MTGSHAGSEDAWLAGIVRSSHDAIVGETLDGTVRTWNGAAEDLYGYRAEEITGQRADRLYPPERRAAEAAVVRQVVGGERPDRYVTERVRRDGTVVTVLLGVSPIVDAAGAITGVASVARRMDECRCVGPELAALVEAVPGALPTRTSHELRTPLQAIIGFTGTLLMRLPGPLNDEQERQLQLVQASARQLLSLINELSRPGSSDRGSPSDPIGR